MKRKLYLTLACVALAACVAGRISQDRSVPSAPAAARAAYTTEQEWLISEIANAILNVTALARGTSDDGVPPQVADLHVAAPPALARFSVTRGAHKFSIDVTDHLWSPGAFVPMARELLGDPKAATTTSPESNLLAALTNPTPEVIQQENIRLSRLLRDNLRSAALHEQAALLIGSLALREGAATLSDPRRMMCRMTAHLATARALTPSAVTVDGRVADVVLLTLVNRQRDAIARLDEIDAGERSPALAAWSRALRVRVTKDWRLVPDVASASLLEQREVLRAANITVGNSRSLAILAIVEPRVHVNDWSRAIFHESPTVEAGNHFAEISVLSESMEALAVRALFPQSPDIEDRAAVIRQLNAEPQAGPATFGKEPEFWIIDWGTWAAASQRHIMASIVCSSRHLRKMLGLPDDALAMETRSREAYGGLLLYPLAERYMAKNAEDKARFSDAVGAAAALVRAHPETITDGAWSDLYEKPDFAAPLPAGLPAHWFKPYFPVGTVFDPHRIYTTHWQVRLDVEQLEALKAIAPYERNVLLTWIDKRFGEKAAIDDVRREVGPLAGYDAWFAWKVARAAMNQPDVYVPIVRNLAESMDGNYWYSLGVYLADYGRDDEAAAAFERYRKVASDRVAASNGMDWLVNYLFDAGRPAEGLHIASDAADVYSYGGLVTYADALDRSGDIRGAERLYRAARERYGPDEHRVDLLAFLLRHQVGNERYRRDAHDMMSMEPPPGRDPLFQAGQEQVVRANLDGAPAAGARITTPGVIGTREGLRAEDIIVAVDGTRVHNRIEYNVMERQSWTPDMRLLVWRDHEYVEVNTKLRHRWVSKELVTHPKPAATH